MNQRELEIKVHLVRFTAELGSLLRDLAIHQDIERGKPSHNVKQWTPYRRTKNAVKSMQRELTKLLENEEWSSIYFRAVLDGSILTDYAKIPYDRVVAKVSDYQ